MYQVACVCHYQCERDSWWVHRSHSSLRPSAWGYMLLHWAVTRGITSVARISLSRTSCSIYTHCDNTRGIFISSRSVNSQQTHELKNANDDTHTYTHTHTQEWNNWFIRLCLCVTHQLCLCDRSIESDTFLLIKELPHTTCTMLLIPWRTRKKFAV